VKFTRHREGNGSDGERETTSEMIGRNAQQNGPLARDATTRAGSGCGGVEKPPSPYTTLHETLRVVADENRGPECG